MVTMAIKDRLKLSPERVLILTGFHRKKKPQRENALRVIDRSHKIIMLCNHFSSEAFKWLYRY